MKYSDMKDLHKSRKSQENVDILAILLWLKKVKLKNGISIKYNIVGLFLT